MKEKQYFREGSPPIPENRLFVYSSYVSKCQVVSATLAMGMGIDIPSVRHSHRSTKVSA